MRYKPTIGMEIHAELKTRTKMFCNSKNDPEESRPNVNICPVCLAHPGTLPVINKQAVQHVLRVGAALGGKLADYTEFDRKNYFSPDLPKGYQISQYEFPLVSGGILAGVSITRIHLEEDTASSMHDEGSNETLLDFNRDVEYEIRRQTGLLEKGEKVIQETRGWDEGKQTTFAQRIKEGSADYRYFPDPDLPSLRLSDLKGFSRDEISKGLPELPSERRGRYITLGIKAEDADLYVRDMCFGDFFDRVVAAFSGDAKRVQLASNYIANDLVNLVAKRRDDQNRDTETLAEIAISEENFRKIIACIADGKISSRGAKDLLAAVYAGAGEPEKLAKEQNLLLSNVDMTPIVEKVLADNPKVVGEYKKGKIASIQFLVGQSMKTLKGSGDPVALRKLIEESLSASE